MTLEKEGLEKIMRSIVAVGLLIALCTSANAAVHYSRTRHHVIIAPGVAASFAAVPAWAYAARRPPAHFSDTPSYDDPSKFGGQSLGMDP
ncbi:hypothetical protein [Bradyrhizobium sp. WSM3983]|uniref:hypothetical protein n=1 Tax=Bradyrhizobium sp. WSM3983 TaxID=1038867 RepID=UPI0012EC698D|nr:hypothetical protein [Bradyrhizobium sp. WSM3983]